jgi:hypothetical protein
MAESYGESQRELEIAISKRIGRFANALSSAVYAQSSEDLEPVMQEVEELLAKSCILERLVFTRNVLNTPGIPRMLIDRLLSDNFLVARMLTQAGFGLDDERTIRLLSMRDEAFQLDVASHDGISERITDYLIEIGGPEVAYRLARNKRAKLSASAILALVERAQNDLRLLQALANRRDLDGNFINVTTEAAEAQSTSGRSVAPASADAPAMRRLRRQKIISHR